MHDKCNNRNWRSFKCHNTTECHYALLIFDFFCSLRLPRKSNSWTEQLWTPPVAFATNFSTSSHAWNFHGSVSCEAFWLYKFPSFHVLPVGTTCSADPFRSRDPWCWTFRPFGNERQLFPTHPEPEPWQPKQVSLWISCCFWNWAVGRVYSCLQVLILPSLLQTNATWAGDRAKPVQNLQQGDYSGWDYCKNNAKAVFVSTWSSGVICPWSRNAWLTLGSWNCDLEFKAFRFDGIFKLTQMCYTSCRTHSQVRWLLYAAMQLHAATCSYAVSRF